MVCLEPVNADDLGVTEPQTITIFKSASRSLKLVQLVSVEPPRNRPNLQIQKTVDNRLIVFEERIMGAVQVIEAVTEETLLEVAEGIDGLFEKIPADALDDLIDQHKEQLEGIKLVSSLMLSTQASRATAFFVMASCKDDGHQAMARLPSFELAPAIAALDAHFWDLALKKTNVLELMPQARRTEWANTIRECKTPSFEENAVRSTLTGMVNDRLKFFAERVDGVFKSLSGSHITNRPEGFNARIIMKSVVTDDYVSSEKGGYLNDLRCVIARLMGRKEPEWRMSNGLLRALATCYGKWVPVDAGVMQMKLFKNGNVHIELGPDMAWKLNTVLATLYPLAIPSQFRSKPKKTPKEFQLMGTPIAFELIRLIGEMRIKREINKKPFTSNPFSFVFESGSLVPDEHRQKAVKVIEFLGGVECRINGFRWYEFDYDPSDAINHLVMTGCIPDKTSHQFYPTKEKLALLAVAQADIQPGDTVLEPEAGQGGIAVHLPADRTTCVEISALQCKVLEAKGLKVENADFLKWSLTAPKFDKVISNPPYSEGRALLHMKASASLVREGGRLIGILPGSLRGKDLFGPGWDIRWSPLYSGEFDGTGVHVAIMTAIKS